MLLANQLSLLWPGLAAVDRRLGTPLRGQTANGDVEAVSGRVRRRFGDRKGTVGGLLRDRLGQHLAHSVPVQSEHMRSLQDAHPFHHKRRLRLRRRRLLED